MRTQQRCSLSGGKIRIHRLQIRTSVVTRPSTPMQTYHRQSHEPEAFHLCILYKPPHPSRFVAPQPSLLLRSPIRLSRHLRCPVRRKVIQLQHLRPLFQVTRSSRHRSPCRLLHHNHSRDRTNLQDTSRTRTLRVKATLLRHRTNYGRSHLADNKIHRGAIRCPQASLRLVQLLLVMAILEMLQLKDSIDRVHSATVLLLRSNSRSHR